MVTRYALVCDGTVENVTLWDGETDWTPPDGCELVALSGDQAVSPGDTYDGKTFTPAPPSTTTVTVPVEVDPQALTDAQAAIAKATTVAALRSAVTAALELLNPAT